MLGDTFTETPSWAETITAWAVIIGMFVLLVVGLSNYQMPPDTKSTPVVCVCVEVNNCSVVVKPEHE